jgi:hypothetical protein
LKTHAGWDYRITAGGIVAWTSPTGHTYTTHPGRWLAPLEQPTWLEEPPHAGHEANRAEPVDAPDPADAPHVDAPDVDAPHVDAPDPADDPAWLAALAQRADPLLEACGPDVHPLLGIPHHPLQPADTDPWAPLDPQADDPLAQDETDWRLREFSVR